LPTRNKNFSYDRPPGFNRVAAGPGKPGSQGKVREFYQSGKVRENDEKIRKVREKQTKN